MLTDDPKHPDLTHGVDETPVPQAPVYLVLSQEEIAKGYRRPLRKVYKHVGIAGPQHPLVDLDAKQIAAFADEGWVKFEVYPKGLHTATGRYWSQKDLDRVGKGCQTVTTMNMWLSETYARDPGFYGATYCVRCSKHLPVGPDGEFVWDGTNERVGT